MKLRGYTLIYLAIALLAILSIWSSLFYFNMLDEVYDSIDDGLDNYKLLIIRKAEEDSTILSRTAFGESNYAILKISKNEVLNAKDIYKDTLMYMQNEEEFEPVRLLTTVFPLHGHYYKLNVISSMVEEDDLIEDLMYATIWLYLAVLFSVLIVNNLLLKRIWKPFYQLLEQLKNFSLSKNKGITLPDTSVPEFRLLNHTVSDMLKQVVETYSSQKQFIENASHELQTPLAISINKLELLAEKNTLSETDLATVGQVIETLERLTRLNKSLLLLSKIENKQFDQPEDIHINAIIHNLVNELDDFASFKGIAIALEEHTQLHTQMHKDLVVMLFSNLLKNAIVHNREKGSVLISISQGTVTISNTGKAAALDPVKIFDRFQKDDTSIQSTGLGLAIVKAILTLYGKNISYSWANGMHTMTVQV